MSRRVPFVIPETSREFLGRRGSVGPAAASGEREKLRAARENSSDLPVLARRSPSANRPHSPRIGRRIACMNQTGDQNGETASRGRRVRWFIVAFAAIAWSAGVFRWWREYVPLVPTRVTKVDPIGIPIGLTRQGEFVYWTSTSLAPPTDAAQVLFVNPKSGAIRRLTAPRGNYVGGTSHPPRALIQNDQKLQVVDLQTGSILHERDFEGDPRDPPPHAAFSQDGRSLAWHANGRGVVIDVETGLDLFTAEGVRLLSVRPATALFEFARRQGDGKTYESIRVDVASGEVDRRFETTARVFVAGDRRHAIVWPNWAEGDTGGYVCEFDTGRKLWDLPSLPGAFAGGWRFDDDNQTVRLAVRVNDGFTVARWNVADGRVIQSVPDGASPMADRDLLMNGKYVLEEGMLRGVWLHPVVTGLLKRVGISSDGMIALKEPCVRVYKATGELLGTLSHTPKLFPTAHLHEIPGGLAVAYIDQVVHFELPPRRAWSKLAGLLLLPPAAVWIGIAAIRVGRARCRKLNHRLGGSHGC